MYPTLTMCCGRSPRARILRLISKLFAAVGAGRWTQLFRKGQKGHSSRAVIDACRPYEWMNEFPPVAESSPEVRRAAEAKWGKILDE